GVAAQRILHVAAARYAGERGLHGGQALLVQPTADVGLEVEVQRRTAPSVVQVHGRAPVVAPDEAGERSHARARADQYDGLARAAQGETGIAADEGLRGVARLQVMKVGGAQAARQ